MSILFFCLKFCWHFILFLQDFNSHLYSVILFGGKKRLNDHISHLFSIPVCAADIEAVCSVLVPLFVSGIALYILYLQEE